MAADGDHPIRLQLEFAADQPGVLEGLDTWMRLGLITEAQVLALGRDQLSCALPPAPVAAPGPGLGAKQLPPARDADAGPAGASPAITDFLPPSAAPPRQRRSVPQPGPPLTPAAPEASRFWLNRLLSELSVVWLLGLGVFLVVLSSAVLAATQWARFSGVGQYLVLLAYTLVFWGVGLGCRRRPNLRLTAQTLQMMTLVLVPLNFWAMDGLGVWGGARGVGVGAIAACLLTLAALQVLRQHQSPGLEQGQLLSLAYLHTGWSFGWMPTLAVYLGVLGSGGVLLHRSAQGHASPPRQPWPRTAGMAALGLLLLRALTVVEPSQWGRFALAFGLYGATWVGLGQRRLIRPAAELTQPPKDTGDPALPPHLQGNPTDRWILGLGRGLMLWGWGLAIADWRAQAFGISVLGLGLRGQALGRWGRRRDLLVAYAIAIQLGFIGWALLPQPLRQAILQPLASWAQTGGGNGVLLGLSLFPYLVGLVALGDRYWRQRQLKLGRFSDGLTLGSSLILTAISTASGPVLVANLIASTLTVFVITWRRSPLSRRRIWVSYGLTVVTVLVTLAQRWPQLPLPGWVGVMFALAAIGLLFSRILPHLWGVSAWPYGVGLAALAYLLLWNHLVETNFRSGLSVVGLVIPIILTWMGRYPASVATTGLAVLLTLGLPWTRLLSLGLATALTALNSRYHQREGVPFLTLGFGLGGVVAGLADWGPGFPRQPADWSGITASLILALWLSWSQLPPAAAATAPLLALYRRACDRWGYLLTLGLLGGLTFAAGWLYLGWRTPQAVIVVALMLWAIALAWRSWAGVSAWTIYLAGWGVELLLAEGMGWRWGTAVTLAVPTLILAGLALALSSVLGRFQPTLVAPLQSLTLAYAGLALVLRLPRVTGWTGWLVVGAALLAWEVGRRRPQAWLRWIALAGLSAGWYELVLYQLLKAPGGKVVDGLILMAGVAALIMGVYGWTASGLAARRRLPTGELAWAAHLHWGLGSGLIGLAGLSGAWSEAGLQGLGVAIATALVIYALLQGRVGRPGELQAAWVYAGLTAWVGWFVLLRLTLPALQGLDRSWGIVACALGVPVYWLPWAAWGWPQRPWRVMAVGVPLAITLLTAGIDHIPTLWVLAGFYGWLAWHSRRLRGSYLAVGCAVWAIWQGLEGQGIQDSLAYVLPLGLALLYGAQFDPGLQRPAARNTRHWLRLIASALVLVTAIASERWTGLPVGLMGLGAIAAGLLLRTRAFLYTGTGIFALNALNQLILLNATYPLVKWVVGIVVGIALIWVAADVERRRAQWLQITQSWLQDLESWQ
ncbi:MAG TPA: hypothetical protein IGR64_17115 [Leptolyngbyaceae cyanobacterium M65_K2018_010]|nr:hypothetical protein [Leptolyngbyaceae cyanobacterium M65_K2018_010]